MLHQCHGNDGCIHLHGLDGRSDTWIALTYELTKTVVPALTVVVGSLAVAYRAFTRNDRRTDRSVRLVYPTGRSDDRIV